RRDPGLLLLDTDDSRGVREDAEGKPPPRMSASGLSLLKPHTRDLGGFSVRRILPGMPHRMVGPFIFFDHMGPAVFAPGSGIDVRPHPHIGLATVTYLFEGEILHRDSLGTVQAIAQIGRASCRERGAKA